MQLNAALPTSHVLRGIAAVSRRVLARSVGLTSCGVRRAQSVVFWSTATVGAGRPSFGGRRKVSGRWRSGVFCVGQVLQPTRCLPRFARAACPSAVSARLRSVQAPRSTARCQSAAALAAKLGHSQARRVLLSLASRAGTSRCSVGAGKRTVVNASQFIGCASANAAPNPSVKRTCLRHAAYLKR
jgi:hypothetical protein